MTTREIYALKHLEECGGQHPLLSFFAVSPMSLHAALETVEQLKRKKLIDLKGSATLEMLGSLIRKHAANIHPPTIAWDGKSWRSENSIVFEGDPDDEFFGTYLVLTEEGYEALTGITVKPSALLV